jgi:hypothetical protein
VWGGIASLALRRDLCQLEDLLRGQQWHEADRATLELMRAIGADLPQEKADQGFIPREVADLYPEDLHRLSCPVLEAIDRLWQTHSDGRFGFGPQAKILQESGNQAGILDLETYGVFRERLGWVDLQVPAEPWQAIPVGYFPFGMGQSNATFGSSFFWQWRIYLNPRCEFSLG